MKVQQGVVRVFVKDYDEKQEEDYLFPRFKKTHQLEDLVDTLLNQHQAGRRLTDQIMQLSKSTSASEGERQQLLQAITVASIEATLAYLEQFGGGKETLYELYTTTAGLYPYLRGTRFWKMFDVGEIQLPANATYKYGTTKYDNVIGGPGQYPARYSPGQVPGLRFKNYIQELGYKCMPCRHIILQHMF
ncbi:MAG: hemerythrin domain-containing protein [Chitinophagaceae bacterium]